MRKQMKTELSSCNLHLQSIAEYPVITRRFREVSLLMTPHSKIRIFFQHDGKDTYSETKPSKKIQL